MEKELALANELKNSIHKLYSNFKKTSKERFTASYCETRLESLESYWKDFNAVHRELVQGIPIKEQGQHPYFTKQVQDACEEVYLELKTYIKEKIVLLSVKVDTNPQPTATHQASTTETVTKLPPIHIPAFSGTYENWTTFHDLFVSLIHDNKKLSNVQKYHYLKSSLTGDAEQLLRHFPLTDANYTKAWELLRKRYNNIRSIVNAHLTKFLNQKKLSQESATGARSLLDTSTECLLALQNLNIQVDTWDPIIVHIVTSKLDAASLQLWEQELGASTELPSFKKLTDFLEVRFRTLEALHASKPKEHKPVIKVLHSLVKSNCPYCSSEHYLCHCKEFSQLETPARREYAQKNNLCFNCLAKGHSVKSCRQTKTCRKCQRKHHTLLHLDSPVPTTETETETKSPQEPESSILTMHTKNKVHSSNVLLPTALVRVQTPDGDTHILRALIDQAAQSSFVSESVAQILRSKKSPTFAKVYGLKPASYSVSRSMIQLTVQSVHDDSTQIKINAMVLKSITSALPSQQVPIDAWPPTQSLKLADPSYHKPGRIDLLLGAEVCPQILEQGLIKNDTYKLMAQNSVFGWLISGEIPISNSNGVTVVLHCRLEIDHELRRFWELEEPPNPERLLTHEEVKCETHYSETHTRNPQGRYIVRLPFSSELPMSLIETKETARKRLIQMEKRFERQPEFKEKYAEFIHDYHTSGHMELVPPSELNKDNVCYLPHHAVIREASETTKLRVVFDGSAQTSKDTSLNKQLLIGPPLKKDIRDLVLRWRRHQISLVADITKMYRQIIIHDDDADYQRILWREDTKNEMKDYRLLTVTYGTSSAPFLAIRTLKQLADDEKEAFPEAAEVLKSDFYMDDLLSGGDNDKQVIGLQRNLTQLLLRGGFELHKWASNSEEVMRTIPINNQNPNKSMTIKIKDSVKALGIPWNPSTDTFHLNIDLPPLQPKVTKRTILSDTAKIFDPLGWQAPIVVVAKIMLQKLWLAGLDWDSELPPTMLQEWIEYRNELTNLPDTHLNRWIGTNKDETTIELHGFCDASCAAYAAVVYARVTTSSKVFVNLVCAKTKVSPVKQVTLPRLELCGAVLLARLLQHAKRCLNVKDSSIYAWTDSMIVLSWLKKNPTSWKTFVANRTTQILDVLNSNQWRHVKSGDNPADCASRGLNPSILRGVTLWWEGPKWLQSREPLPLQTPHIPETEIERKVSCFFNLVDNDFVVPYLARYSTLSRLVRVTAYCLRFVKNCKLELLKQTSKLTKNHLTAEELKNSLDVCIRMSQSVQFPHEISQLSKGKCINKKSTILCLNPILYSDNILRVGGRLENSACTESVKHPIILGQDTALAELLVAYIHKVTLHGGPQLMLTQIRKKYWILRCKNLVKKHYRSCLTCFKYSAKPLTQIMGNLPAVRVTPKRPFSVSGVDFAGPINFKLVKGRGSKVCKAYIALFVCTTIKAVHLELVSDLSTQGFLAAFRRFTSRRGHCRELLSDCGTNFVGASKELRLMFKASTKDLPNELSDLLANDGTTWKFIPPGSPHFRGLWEAGVKSMKTHLKRVIGEANLTFEEYATLLSQVEACLNSRPLTPLSESSSDSPLTPCHFLIGESSFLVPDENVEAIPNNRLDRWKLLQQMLQGFWKCWNSEYLSTLQQRYKWQLSQEDPKIGAVVLVKDERLPVGKWLLGRIIQVHPGTDRRTRVVSLKCKNNVIKRPVAKICPLPIES